MIRSEILSPAMPAAAASGAVAEVDPNSGGFFERPFVQNFLPFLTSLSFHAGVLILGLLTYTAITIVQRPTQIQVNVAETELPTGPVVPQYNGDTNNPFLRPMQDQTPNANEGTSFTAGASGMAFTRGGGGGDEGNVIAVGAHESFGGPGGVGPAHGPGYGPGGETGLLAVWGPKPMAGGSPVFRSSHLVHRIAYVCDASGSMINKMASLKAELEKAVTHLVASQSFSIIFFQDQKRPDMFNEALVLASPQNIRKAGVFLEGVTSTGTTDPIPGLEAAFRQQPELIFLLTDGDFPDNDLVLSKIRTLNKEKKVRINTIAFVGSNDTDVAFLGLLKTIANENGGSFKHVSEDELGN